MIKGDEVRLTFSQREGKAPLPEPMRLQHLSKPFRNLLWLLVDRAIEDSYPKPISSFGVDYDNIYKNSSFGKLMQVYFFRVRDMPHDEMEHSVRLHSEYLRNMILNGDYHPVLTFIEFFLREIINERVNVLASLGTKLRQLFERQDIAYIVQRIQQLPTIVPRTSTESARAIESALETVEQKGSDGAKAHLRKAAERLNAKEYADSVRESISAVESVARTIDPKASKELRPALDSLEKARVLKHKVFKGALNKLYAYTSDEEGIRHSLLDEGAADVGLDEAVFMFGACAIFCDYLLNRRQQIT